MRYRLMATYQGVPYEAGIGPADGDVVLFAACPPPEELGFEPATGHWRKQLRLQDVQALWESRPMGLYRGQRCLVLDDLGDRLHIAYLGHDAYQAQQLGYWQVDRGVFELVTPRDEVAEVTEERSDYPGQATGLADQPRPAPDYGPAAGHGPAADDRPAPDYGPASDYDPATADYGPAMAGYAHSGADYRPGADYGPATADFGPVTADFAGTTAGLAAAPIPPDFGDSTAGGLPASPAAPGFTVMPTASEPPLPLEAAALRAASAATSPRRRQPDSAAPQPARAPQPSLATQEFSGPQESAVTQSPLVAGAAVATASPSAAALPAAQDGPAAPTAAGRPAAESPGSLAAPGPASSAPGPGAPAPRRRRSARSRMATQGIFIELATLAAIPAAAYAVGEEVDGALCLIETGSGFEVFSAAGGARHEVRAFEDEESAYFYLFGVLAAEAVRTGLLIPHR
jgi:hypothetical protein